jgi:hypothetical protein
MAMFTTIRTVSVTLVTSVVFLVSLFGEPLHAQPRFVAVDFHAHFFSHYGATGSFLKGTAASNWETQLKASERLGRIDRIFNGKIVSNGLIPGVTSINAAIPEAAFFTEHAGWSTYNYPGVVRDLETKVTQFLNNQPSNIWNPLLVAAWGLS